MLRSVVFSFAAALLLAPLALADEPKDKDKPAAPPQESGTWIPTDGMSAGKKLPDNFLTNVKLMLNQGKYTVVVGEDKEEGTYKVDTSKTPYAIDVEATMGPNKGKKIPAIVEIKREDTVLSYVLDLRGARP